MVQQTDWRTLLQEFNAGAVSRRLFVSSALALGASGGAIAKALAQDGCGPCEEVHSVAAKSMQATPGTGGPIYPEGWIGPMVEPQEPLSAEKVTLRVVVPNSENAGDWATNSFTTWLEERTNVHIEFQEIAGTTEERRVVINAMIAGGDLPDIFMGDEGVDFTPAQLLFYGQQGIFIPLNDLIAQHSPRYAKIITDYPTVADIITAPDGNIYTMPNVNDCYHCQGSCKLWINKAWLDQLGLAVPQTVDEFEAALKAFKEMDPNGNGQADELGLVSGVGDEVWTGVVSSNSGRSNGSLDNFFMGSFLYNPGEPWLVLNEGKVDVTFNKPGWREGLKYLNRLYAGGLVAPESFSQNDEGLKRMGDNPDGALIGAAPGGYWGVFLTIDQQTDGARWEEYVTVPPLTGPDGTRVAGWNHYGAASTNGRFVITSSCEQPEIAVAWADAQYELETLLRGYHGVLGEHWAWAEEGEMGINGKQGVWKPLVTWASDAMRGAWWDQRNSSYRSSDFRLAEVVDPENPTFEAPLYQNTVENYFPYAEDISLQLPPLYLTEEQAGQVGELATTINGYVLESIAAFTLGDRDPNDDGAWDEYISTLDSMGVAPYLESWQAAYDAKGGGQ